MDARIDELLEMEQIALEEVHRANIALDETRAKAVINANIKDIDEISPIKKNNDSGEEEQQPKKGHHKRLSSLRHSEHKIDLDAVKNLLGKDSSVVTKANGLKRAKTTGDSNVEVEFEFESKLWEKGPRKDPHALDRPSIVSRSQSESATMSSPFQPPGEEKNMNIHGKHHVGLSSSGPRQDNGLHFYNFDMSEATLHDDVPSISELECQTLDNQQNMPHVLPPIVPLHDFDKPLKSNEDGGESTWSNHSAPPIASGDDLEFNDAIMHADPESQDHVGNRPHLFSEPTVCSPNHLLPNTFASSFGSSPSPSVNFGVSPRPSVRKRKVSAAWEMVEAVAHDSCETGIGGSIDEDREVATGKWEMASITNFLRKSMKRTRKLLTWTSHKSNQAVDVLARDSTFAVVTFTSRQAAVTARRCLADGRGTDRWRQIESVPIPPLADAAACDLHTCRGCCRPVTLSINDNQKKWRKYL